MNAHPYDAAEALDKLARWTSMETGRAQLQRVYKQFVGWDLLDTNRPAVTRLLGDVDAARLYWVTPPMMSLLGSAAEQMPYQTLRRHDLPIDTGFVMLADELATGNEQQPIRAVNWSTTSDLDTAESVRVTIWFSRETAAANNNTTTTELRNAGIPPLVPVRWFDWNFELNWRDTYAPEQFTPDPEVEDLRAWVADLRRWMQALFAIMTEKYVTQDAPSSTKAERRRAERAGWELARIRVIDLRRARSQTSRSSANDGSSVEWTQQWWVSGHWRNQWYPSTEEHRLRYIGPHTKGPQDKPLGPPPKRIFKIDTPPAG